MNRTVFGETYQAAECLAAKFTTLSLLIIGLCVSTTTVHAAEKVYWYQVELLIFTQPDGDLRDEYWDEQLRPSFRGNAIQLLSPEQLRQLPSRSNTDPSSGRPTPLRQEYSDGAFVLLKPSQRIKINDDEEPITPISRKRLRQGGHRILMDATWNQPVHDPGKNRPIAIRGGQPLNNGLFELEGELTLSLARFLHLRPNLFLSRPLPANWQRRHPEAVALESAEANASFMPQHTAPENANDALNGSDRGSDVGAIDRSDDVSNTGEINTLAAEQQPVSQSKLSGYLSTRMDQPRRMRRNELHYLDHPQFGLLIRLTPIDAPSSQATSEEPTAPQTQQAAEQPNSPHDNANNQDIS